MFLCKWRFILAITQIIIPLKKTTLYKGGMGLSKEMNGSGVLQMKFEKFSSYFKCYPFKNLSLGIPNSLLKSSLHEKEWTIQIYSKTAECTT